MRWSNDVANIWDLENVFFAVDSTAAKADSILTTTTTGTQNIVFESELWMMLNTETNAFSVLPKYPWRRSGNRVITARSVQNTTNNNTTLGGIAEGGKLPELSKPTWQEISFKPKQVGRTFGASLIEDYLATRTDDDSWGGMNALRAYMADEFIYWVNSMLMTDNEAAFIGSSGNYSGTTDFEPFDRIISSYGESSAIDAANSSVTNTKWFDAYNQYARETSTDTKFDSQVVSPSGTITTNGYLTRDVFTEIVSKIRKASGSKPTFFLSTHDVYADIQHLYDGQVRYQGYGQANMTVDIGGVQSSDGHHVQIQVSQINGVPLLETAFETSYSTDTSEAGRIFAINSENPEGNFAPRFGIGLLAPITYMENSPNGPASNAWIFARNQTDMSGAFLMIGENICRHPISQGKIRDIKLR